MPLSLCEWAFAFKPLRHVQAGITKKKMADMFQMPPVGLTDSDLEPLGFQHLLGPALIFCIGLTIALVVVLTEVAIQCLSM